MFPGQQQSGGEPWMVEVWWNRCSVWVLESLVHNLKNQELKVESRDI